MSISVEAERCNKNGFVTVSKEQLQKAFDNFAGFHGEIEKHPNIVLIKQLLDSYNQPEGYQTIDVVASVPQLAPPASSK